MVAEQNFKRSAGYVICPESGRVVDPSIFPLVVGCLVYLDQGRHKMLRICETAVEVEGTASKHENARESVAGCAREARRHQQTYVLQEACLGTPSTVAASSTTNSISQPVVGELMQCVCSHITLRHMPTADRPVHVIIFVVVVFQFLKRILHLLHSGTSLKGRPLAGLAPILQATYEKKPHTSLADEATYLCDTVKCGPQPSCVFFLGLQV